MAEVGGVAGICKGPKLPTLGGKGTAWPTTAPFPGELE